MPLCLEGCKKSMISQWELKWLVSQKEVSFFRLAILVIF